MEAGAEAGAGPGADAAAQGVLGNSVQEDVVVAKAASSHKSILSPPVFADR